MVWNIRLNVALLAIAAAGFIFAAPCGSLAACATCADFLEGMSWGTLNSTSLDEASGIAASVKNPGVLWTHNDGSRQKLYAISTNGTLLATFDLGQAVQDLEDIAVAPGQDGVSCIYLGDIGASATIDGARREVQVLRIPEPTVDLAWGTSPPSRNIQSLAVFALAYPDGGYDAEALMVDAKTSTVFVVTKQNGGGRLYSATLGDAPALTMKFERTVPFADVSGGDISADGARIVLRREDYAVLWARCEGETVSQALAREGKSVPVIGPPEEPNGEAIGFLPDGAGYVTISEGLNPHVYFFRSLCPAAPKFMTSLTNQSVYAGAGVMFAGAAAGYPAPAYSWRFNGAVLPGQNSNTLVLKPVTTAQAGSYELVASNSIGSTSSVAVLTVRTKPDLRITEVQSSTAPSPNVPSGDWWELTSFETVPVSLAGWKFNDSTGGLSDPYTLGAGLTIAPGESVVFVEQLTRAQFVGWWGETNLPLNLQVVSYSGPGLSLAAGGDGIRLWTDQATVDTDTVAQVDFPAARNGVTFGYNPQTGQFGQLSQTGVFGAFKAGASADIGSPGRIDFPPVHAPELSARLSNGSLGITFDAVAGIWYRLQSCSSPSGGVWGDVGTAVRATTSGPMSFETSAIAPRSFFRVAASAMP